MLNGLGHTCRRIEHVARNPTEYHMGQLIPRKRLLQGVLAVKHQTADTCPMFSTCDTPPRLVYCIRSAASDLLHYFCLVSRSHNYVDISIRARTSDLPAHDVHWCPWIGKHTRLLLGKSRNQRHPHYWIVCDTCTCARLLRNSDHIRLLGAFCIVKH